jgi:glycosyltransferase involved in cell wall biosynthesis
VPVHNEAAHLDAFVTEFLGSLPPLVAGVLYEVLLVENGSTDDTREVCHRLATAHPGLVRVLCNPRGSYGEAVRRGLAETVGTHVSVLECDFLDSGFLANSIRLFQQGDVRFIVASKQHPESVDHRPFKRRLLTRGFNMLLRAGFRYPGSDTHGLKSIEGPLARELCQRAITTDEVFQSEIVLLAWRLGHRIVELPIRIEERRATPVALARRLPSVVSIVKALHRSLKRYPAVPGGMVVRRSPVERAQRGAPAHAGAAAPCLPADPARAVQGRTPATVGVDPSADAAPEASGGVSHG